MPFVEVKLSDVALEKPSPVPVGDYVFQLRPGATWKENKFNQIQELNMAASVAEGDFAGRVVFWRYPDPAGDPANGIVAKPWSAQAMKKLEISLGVDSNEGEGAAEYFNRVALNSVARFSGSLVPETRKNKETGEYEPYVREGETEPRAVFNIFSVGAAA